LNIQVLTAALWNINEKVVELKQLAGTFRYQPIETVIPFFIMDSFQTPGIFRTTDRPIHPSDGTYGRKAIDLLF